MPLLARAAEPILNRTSMVPVGLVIMLVIAILYVLLERYRLNPH